MIASRVKTDKEIEDWLLELGFESTQHNTETGRFWRCNKTGRHVQIPNSIDGFRPDWQINEITEVIKVFDPHRFDTKH